MNKKKYYVYREGTNPVQIIAYDIETTEEAQRIMYSCNNNKKLIGNYLIGVHGEVRTLCENKKFEENVKEWDISECGDTIFIKHKDCHGMFSQEETKRVGKENEALFKK